MKSEQKGGIMGPIIKEIPRAEKAVGMDGLTELMQMNEIAAERLLLPKPEKDLRMLRWKRQFLPSRQLFKTNRYKLFSSLLNSNYTSIIPSNRYQKGI